MTEERNSITGAGSATWPMMLSLALNLFLVGVIAAPFLDRHMDGGVASPPFLPRHGFMLGHMERVLAPEEAAKVRTIFEEERKNAPLRREDMEKTQRDIAVIIKAEKPDVQALRKVLDTMQIKGKTMHEGMARAVVRIATEVSFEGRKKIAEAMEMERGPMPMPPMDGGTMPPEPPR